MIKKLSRVLCLLLVAIMLMGMATIAYAETIAAYGQVSADTTLYKSAGKTVLGTIEAGGKIGIISESSSGYYRVQAGSYVGYVPVSSVKLISGYTGETSSVSTGSTTTTSGSTTTSGTAATTGTAGFVTNCKSWVSMREGTSTSSKRLAKITLNTPVTILGQSGGYYKVSVNGQTGYILSSYVASGSTSTGTAGTTTGTATGSTTTAGVTTYTTAKSATSLDSSIVMRVNPVASTTDNKVATVKNASGKTFTLLGESGDFYLAQYGSYQGYVRMTDFSVTGATTTTPVNGTASATQAATGTVWGSINYPGSPSSYKIYCNALNSSQTAYQYDTYSTVWSVLPSGQRVSIVMAHNMRKSKAMFHNLHHIQNAYLGVSKCESCKASCSSSLKQSSWDINFNGSTKWTPVCFYEVPKTSAGKNIYVWNLQNTASGNWLSTQLSYAQSSSYKGMVVGSASANDKLLMLITCGDTFGSDYSGNIFFVLKAIN